MESTTVQLWEKYTGRCGEFECSVILLCESYSLACQSGVFWFRGFYFHVMQNWTLGHACFSFMGLARWLLHTCHQKITMTKRKGSYSFPITDNQRYKFPPMFMALSLGFRN